MYAVDPELSQRFLTDLRAALAEAGLTASDELGQPNDLLTHWCDPSLLLSQTCGYPFVTELRQRVRYVCTPRFRVPGCEGPFYRSAIVVREDELARTIADFRGRCVAFNGSDSQSGYNVLRFMVAPYAREGRFFARRCETGSHRASLAAIRDGRADLAAVDAITLALLASTYPDEVRGVRVLAYSPAAPGLPLITARTTSTETLERLRRAARIACDPRRPAAQALRLDGIEILHEAAYDVIAAMRRDAETLGYPDLT